MSLFKNRLQSTGLCRLDNCNNSERSSNRFIKTSEAPYQTTGQRTWSATLGYKELTSAHFWLSLLSECLSCYIYVFIVCSTRISWTGAIIGHEPNLIAMALSSGIAMMLLIFTFRTVHVNPALTISFLLTGRIPIVRAILYVIAHCLGSIAAIAFLYSISIKGHAGALGLDKPHDVLNSWQILVVEIVISFVVTLATYATCNYSSYTCAKKQILHEIGENSDLLSVDTCDDNNPVYHQLSKQHTVRPFNLNRRGVAPIVPEPPNFRTLPPSSCMPSNIYQEDSSECEYDNHRIYATQQRQSESSPRVSIEENMQSECQLLAPNGFALHLTTGQAFVIGLAYTLTSLSGIPASGASLNPARSFGPAFIMNHWDRHWIYWLGPILGAVVAGFFYEFIFSPTRSASLCYRPKLFRLSAHDMAKVGSKSRLYQKQQLQQQLYQQQQHNFSPSAIVRPSAATIFRPNQLHNHSNSQMLHSTSTSARLAMPSSLMGGTSLLKPSRDAHQTLHSPPMISAIQTQAANNQICGNQQPQLYFMQQQQQQQQQQRHQKQQQFSLL